MESAQFPVSYHRADFPTAFSSAVMPFRRRCQVNDTNALRVPYTFPAGVWTGSCTFAAHLSEDGAVIGAWPMGLGQLAVVGIDILGVQSSKDFIPLAPRQYLHGGCYRLDLANARVRACSPKGFQDKRYVLIIVGGPPTATAAKAATSVGYNPRTRRLMDRLDSAAAIGSGCGPVGAVGTSLQSGLDSRSGSAPSPPTNWPLWR